MDRRGFNQKKQLVAQHLKHPCQLGFRNHTDHFFFLLLARHRHHHGRVKNASRLCRRLAVQGGEGGEQCPSFVKHVK